MRGCGCGAELNLGHRALGSHETWYLILPRMVEQDGGSCERAAGSNGEGSQAGVQ